MTREVLGQGSADGPARRWPWVVAAVLAALLGAGWYADGAARDRTADALVAAALSGEQVADAADLEVGAAIAYSQPLLLSAAAPADVSRDLDALVRSAADRAAPRAATAATTVEEVRVLPWHGSLADARDALAGYLAARAALLDRASADLSSYWVPRDDQLVLRERAATAFAVAGADVGRPGLAEEAGLAP